MTVSWMAPLISLGNSRQLNDNDVWFLGYEFQHRKLHDRFRELQGSVLRRLLEANGLDLLIISTLAVIEQVASTYLSHTSLFRLLTLYRLRCPSILAKNSSINGRYRGTQVCCCDVCDSLPPSPVNCKSVRSIYPMVWAKSVREITRRNDHNAL